MNKTCLKCFQLKPSTDFYKHVRSKDGLQPWCKDCKRPVDAAHYKADPKKHQRLVKKREQKLKTKLNDFKTGKGCTFCGEKEPVCLDFHHLTEKDFNISRGYKLVKWIKVLEEIEKCIVVCSNCHRKIHAGLIVSA